MASFITYVNSGKLEGMPRTAFYGDVMFTRILNKPAWTTTTRQVPLLGGDPMVVEPVHTNHQEGLCIWSLAGMLKMKSRQTGTLFACRTTPGSQPIKHAPLSTVTVATVLRLLADTEFTGKAAESVKVAIRAKVETDTWRFLPE